MIRHGNSKSTPKNPTLSFLVETAKTITKALSNTKLKL